MWDRVLLYGCAGLVAAVLAWAGFFREPTPDPAVRMDEVLSLAAEGRMDEARKVVALLREEHPEDPRGPLLAGYIAEGTGSLEEAREAYLDAVPLCHADRQRGDVMLSVADLSRRMGDTEDARRRLQEVVERHGESDRSRHLRILIALDEGSHDRALSELDRLAEENPGHPVVRRLRKDLADKGVNQASGPADTAEDASASGGR